MQQRSLWSTSLSIVLLAALTTKAGEFDIIPVGPLGKVPKLGKVGDDIPKPWESVRASGENKYVACWTWDVAKEPKWRCTQKYADPRDADEFATYQAGRYAENGFVGKWPVDPKAWDDPDQRKKIMEAFWNQAVPKRLKQIADELELKGKADRAALVRKQIQFVGAEWVDVKPVLPKGVKVSDGQPTRKVGYDDDALVSKTEQPKANPLIGVWTRHSSIPGKPMSTLDIEMTLNDGQSGIYVTTGDLGAKPETRRGNFRWKVVGDELLLTFPDNGNYIIKWKVNDGKVEGFVRKR